MMGVDTDYFSRDESTERAVIAPSVLSADFTNLGAESEAVLEAGADWLHIDVMDGHYVPNLTIGLPVIEGLRRRFPQAVLDVHIMVENPDEVALDYVSAGADIVSFHPEAATHTHRVIQQIHEAGARASVALNPATPVSGLEHVASDLDMILVMSVNPGFSGQTFIEQTYTKLRGARRLLDDWGRGDMPLQVDGGVKVGNISQIADAGADAFVSGSGIFGASDYTDRIKQMRAELSDATLV
jgi:ribulose-phosphate 3-epimerase